MYRITQVKVDSYPKRLLKDLVMLSCFLCCRSLRRWCLSILMLGASSISGVCATYEVVTGIAPPYQYLEEGQLKGEVVQLVKCAFDGMGVGYEIDVYPWRRGIIMLNNSQVDMAFSLDEVGLSAVLGTPSVPVVLEKWFWFTTHGKVPAHLDNIAVVAGTSQEYWLTQTGFTNLEFVSSYESAFQMLAAGRVSAILVDEKQGSFLTSTNAKRQIPIFARFSTLTAVYSPEVSKNHQSFIEQYNQKILECGPIGMSMDVTTEDKLDRLSEQFKLATADLSNLLLTTKMSSFSTRQYSEGYVAEEALWLSARDEGQQFVAEVMDNKLSAYLQNIEAQFDLVITEIILTDNAGRAVAASQKPTDFWQGDESNFTEAINLPANATFVSGIYFDQSTGFFQSQISIPIRLTSETSADYVVIVGVNVERLFFRFPR